MILQQPWGPLLRLKVVLSEQGHQCIVGFPLVTLTCVVIFLSEWQRGGAGRVHKGWLEHWMVKLQEVGERHQGSKDEG